MGQGLGGRLWFRHRYGFGGLGLDGDREVAGLLPPLPPLLVLTELALVLPGTEVRGGLLGGRGRLTVQALLLKLSLYLSGPGGRGLDLLVADARKLESLFGLPEFKAQGA